MRFTNIRLEELDLDYDNSGSYIVPATDELIELTNNIRKRQGNTDLVGVEYDNDVYYNFYLMFDVPNQAIKLEASSNLSEKDDWVMYDIQLFPEEERMLMFKVIGALVQEITEG